VTSLFVAAALAAGGCAGSGGVEVAVTGTDSACTLEKNDLPAGKLTFRFTNRAEDVNELYVLKPDGDVVAEVENVTTGTNRELNVDLPAGDYQVRCKPGQTGTGFSSDFSVTGTGGAEPKTANRTVSFKATDFSFVDLDVSDILAGDTVRFEMLNEGTQPHEYEVLDPAGDAIGEIAGVERGKRGAATITFGKAGRYTYQCILKDAASGKEHSRLGMKGTFTVGSE
jgi:plastocyanin